MVAFIVYLFSERNYDFGIWLNEFIYDIERMYGGLLFYYIARFGYQRLIGEASPITRDTSQITNDNVASTLPDYLLVKKLNKEFLVQVTDIRSEITLTFILTWAFTPCVIPLAGFL